MGFRMTHVFTCDLCGRNKAQEFSIPVNGNSPMASIPEGWTIVANHVVCPEHSRVYVSRGRDGSGVFGVRDADQPLRCHTEIEGEANDREETIPISRRPDRRTDASVDYGF